MAKDGAVVTEHTFYQASVSGRSIDLMGPPWVEFAHLWKHPSDYSATHKLAEAAANAAIQWIQYESARAPCCALAAVLTPDALIADDAALERSRQEWICKATHDAVMMKRKNGAEQLTGEQQSQPDIVPAGQAHEYGSQRPRRRLTKMSPQP